MEVPLSSTSAGGLWKRHYFQNTDGISFRPKFHVSSIWQAGKWVSSVLWHTCFVWLPTSSFSLTLTHTRTSAAGRNPTPLLPVLRKSDFRSEGSLNQKNLGILFFPPDSAETASPRWGPSACNFVHVLFHRQRLTRMGMWVICNSAFQRRVCPLCLDFYSGSICFTLPSNHSDVSTLSSGYDECNFPMFAWIPHSTNQQLSKAANTNN